MDNLAKLNLYEHNKESYGKIKDAFNNGQNIAGIVHATGTGKTYNALALAIENPDKVIVFITPTNAIIEHIKETIKEHGLDLPNLKFRTYSSIIEKKAGDLSKIKADYIVLDEIHHLGAPIWGYNVKKLIDTHEDTKILGMSAYTVRDRKTAQERDIALSGGDEIFSDKIVSTYSIVDAMSDLVLPKPIYRCIYTKFEEDEKQIEERLARRKQDTSEYKMLSELLANVKKQIHTAPGIKDILAKNIKPNGKYIYFCPPVTKENQANIEDIKKQAVEWFKEITDEENIVFYTTTSEMAEVGKANRDAFYNDTDLDGKDVKNKLRVMFAINQYNEGVHAPNVDGVIMGRSTSSDIVFFEQLGRALCVRGDTKEEIERYSKLSLRELREECKKRDLTYTDFDTEEILINKLTAPVIIDLVNNYDYIKELENNLRNKIEESTGMHYTRTKKTLKDYKIDVEQVNQNIHETLDYVNQRLNLTWEDYYEYAKAYYEHYGDLEIPSSFRTSDGYTNRSDGFIGLGSWLISQRLQRRDKILTNDRIEQLDNIGMRWDNIRSTKSWKEMYHYAELYYENHNHLEVPKPFKTNDGYNYDKNGTIKLGMWIAHQRDEYNHDRLSQERIDLLNKIGMRFNKLRERPTYEQMLELAKVYKEHHGDLEVPYAFVTDDGYTLKEDGKYNLGTWISHRKSEYKDGSLSEEKIKELEEIGLNLDSKHKKTPWDKMYEYAVAYYNEHGNIDVPKTYVTEDGIRLGTWIANQRKAIIDGKIEPYKKHNLELLNIRTEKVQLTFEEGFEIAKAYYDEHHTIDIPYESQVGDFNLGRWVARQRSQFNNGELSQERIDKLKEIGFRFKTKVLTWDESFEKAKAYYNEHGNIELRRNQTEDGYDLGRWIASQRTRHNNGLLTSEEKEKLESIGMRFKPIQNTWEETFEYAKKYFEHYGNLEVPGRFKTNDGVHREDDGRIALGKWVTNLRTRHNAGVLDPKLEKELEKYGIIWNVNKNNDSKASLLRTYGIDYEKNKSFIIKMPLQILEAKLLFCLDNSIPLTQSDGKLNQLFFMSNQEFENKNGINIQDLITKYYSGFRR